MRAIINRASIAPRGNNATASLHALNKLAGKQISRSVLQCRAYGQSEPGQQADLLRKAKCS